MKRYRILTDSERYRVQRHVRFGPINYWQTEKYYEVKESYPKVVAHRVEFDKLEEARDYVNERLKEEKPTRRWWPFAIPKGWQVVEKFSDA
ncbi:MAG: hypothetical protein ACQKBU_04855, partial [Verrucomicrobiales bacterium]